MSVASGDVHNDGWADLLILGDHEIIPNLILYSNIGGKRFVRQSLPVSKEIGTVILASLVDLNGDGWMDILFSTYAGQNFIIYNEDFKFQENNVNNSFLVCPLGCDHLL